MFGQPGIPFEETEMHAYGKISPRRKKQLASLFTDSTLPNTTFQPLLSREFLEVEDKKNFERSETKEVKTVTTIRSPGKCSQYIMTALSGATAASEAIGVGLSMDDMNPGEKILGFIPNTGPMKTIVPILYFFQYIAIYCGPAIENMQETVKAIINGKAPEDWPQISSTCKKIIAYFAGVLPALYAAFSDFINAFYSAKEQQWHPLISTTLGISSLLTTLFSEGFETIKKIADLFADSPAANEESKSHPADRFAPLIKLLGLIGAFEDTIESYAALTETYPLAGWGTPFLAGSTIAALCGYIFGIKTTTTAFRSFYDKASAGPSPEEAAAFTLALLVGAAFGHLQRAFFLTMLAAPSATLPFTLPPLVTSIIGGGVAANGALYNMIGLTPFFNTAFKKLLARPTPLPLEDIELKDFKESDFQMIQHDDAKEEDILSPGWEMVSPRASH